MPYRSFHTLLPTQLTWNERRNYFKPYSVTLKTTFSINPCLQLVLSDACEVMLLETTGRSQYLMRDYHPGLVLLEGISRRKDLTRLSSITVPLAECLSLQLWNWRDQDPILNTVHTGSNV